MSNYIRSRIPGGVYFFTVVTFNRRKLLTSTLARQILRATWKEVQSKHPFAVEANCLLPEHLHCIWRLPQNDDNYATRWNVIKGMFSRRYLKAGGQQGMRNRSRSRKREAAIWQRRYWEHQIKDDSDFEKHVDYIHFNPVKHGLQNLSAVIILSEIEHGFPVAYMEGTLCSNMRVGAMGATAAKHLARPAADKTPVGKHEQT